MRLVRSETSKKERIERGYEKQPYIEVLPDEQIKKFYDSDDAVLICETHPLAGFEYTTGICEKCGCTIQYRPYNEPFIHKLCIGCASKL